MGRTKHLERYGESPRFAHATYVMLAFLLFLAGCTRPESSWEKSVQFGMYQNRVTHAFYVMIHDDELLQAVRSVAQEIMIANAIPPSKYQLHIINSPEANAFTLAGGHIYLTTGMLDFIESKDQLAGILAHEIVHGENDHPFTNFYDERDSKIKRDVFIWSGMIAVGVATAGASAAAMGPPVTSLGPGAALTGSFLTATYVAYGMQIASLGLVGVSVATEPIFAAGQHTYNVTRKGYDEEDEIMADQIAVSYLLDTHYDPNHLAAFFRKQESIQQYFETNK